MNSATTTSKIKISDRRHTWIDSDGIASTVVGLGDVDLFLDDLALTRALARRFTEAADDLEHAQAEYDARKAAAKATDSHSHAVAAESSTR